MSLVQRVSLIETTDLAEPRHPGASLDADSNTASADYGTFYSHHPHGLRNQRSLRHVLSYDAFPQPELPSQATDPTGGVTPYKVSGYRRFAQVCFTVLICWLASGIVFGFAALKPVLIDQGVYHHLCPTNELDSSDDVCYHQELRLNMFFAMASTTCNVSALPVGTVLDRCGPRMCAVIGSICLAVGSLLLAFAFHIPAFDGYLIGNVFLALGGTFIFVPSYAIANAFPRFSGTIVATVTGAFDASAAVFLLYRIVYDSSHATFSPEKFFFLYLIVPALITVGHLTLMSEDAYKTVPQMEVKIEKAQDATRDVHDSDEELDDGQVKSLRSRRREARESKLDELDKLLGDADERRQRADREEDRQAASRVWGVLHGKTAAQQMLTPWFILIALLTVLQMLRMNFFIATVKAQYTAMLGSEALGQQVNSFFDVALPIGGVAATPFIGILLDRLSTASMLAVLVGLITAVGLVGSVPFLWAGYVNVVLFVLLRPLYYSAMSDYAAKIFGFATFGRVYGCIIALSGLVNLTQPMIDTVNHEVFHDNPIPINVALAGLGCFFGVSLVLYVWVQGKQMSRHQAALETDLERERVIIEVDESVYSDG